MLKRNQSYSACLAQANPKIIGQRFKGVGHSTGPGTTSGGVRIEPINRVDTPSVHLSGDYICKVASFFTKESRTHNLIFFGEQLVFGLCSFFSSRP